MSDEIEFTKDAVQIVSDVTQEIRDLLNERRHLLGAYPAIFLFQNVLANLLMEMFVGMALPGNELSAYEDFSKQFNEAFLKQLEKKALAA